MHPVCLVFINVDTKKFEILGIIVTDVTFINKQDIH